MVVITEEVLDTTIFDKNPQNIYCNQFFRETSRTDSKGIIILLKKDEKLSDFIDQIDVNVEKIGISMEREDNDINDIRDDSGNIIELDLSNVEFSRFPNLKSLEIRWRYFGINNKSLANCKKLETLFIGTPTDNAFETDASAFYELDNLKILSVNGWGLAYLGKKFKEFIENEIMNRNRKIMYNFFC